MYSDVFCQVYNVFGWNYYPEAFGQSLLRWLAHRDLKPERALDLACGTGVLCRLLSESGIVCRGMDLSPGMIEIARQAGGGVEYDVADMTCYRPAERFDLVTCTGDAVNHIVDLADVEKIFRNVYDCLNDGGWFVFDLLNEREVSTSEPFEMDFTPQTKVWFQMTRPTDRTVNLKIRVFEDGQEQLEENIRETLHDPEAVCALLGRCGFREVKRADTLLPEEDSHGTTWFITARK